MLELNVKTVRPTVKTRTQRRNAIAAIVRMLIDIRAAELKCLENVPRNFSFSYSSHMGENAVESIDTALEFLTAAYDSDSCRGKGKYPISYDVPLRGDYND
jgi:hypothetical protein